MAASIQPRRGRFKVSRCARGPWLIVAAITGLAVSAFLAALGVGAVAVDPVEVAAILGHALGLSAAGINPVHETVISAIRLPRAVLGCVSGAALAVAGAAMQGLFRNPLADPGLIGVSTGAALAAATAIVLNGFVAGVLPFVPSRFLIPAAAFVGGLGVTLLIYRIATRDGQTEVGTLLLAGVAINAIAGAAIGLLVFVSSNQELRDLNFWLLGSLGGTTWSELLPVVPFIIGPTVALPLFARVLDALLLGETEALHLGFSVERCKRWMVGLGALAVGGTVALTGVIGFVGLVVPHLVRLLLGASHRWVMPLSAVLGAALLLIADLVARTIVLPAELPVGIVTSCLGGPFFLGLLLRRRGTGWA
ncbi:FecCD family ABC transporter permease [Salinisphaera orenii]|uniref:FecCD family ABC transporter permease n=1 Tax=Salinisphaera orenii TaxID=856731 RepID=UPI000DBE5DD3